jgi:hypothetical protein
MYTRQHIASGPVISENSIRLEIEGCTEFNGIPQAERRSKLLWNIISVVV